MKTLVFVVASGRSGSTVFSKFLGMHSQCFALSEPQSFDYEIKHDSLCSCSSSYSECDFWKSVTTIVGPNLQTSTLLSSNKDALFIRILRIFNLFFYYKFKIPILYKKFVKSMEDNALLLRSVAKKVEESVIIDASKDISRAIYLSKLLGNDFNCKFIFLIREPVASIFSKTKKKYTISLGGGKQRIVNDPNVMNLDFAIVNWIRSNKLIFLLLKIFGIKYSTIEYEQFATNPKLIFDNLAMDLNLKWESSMLNLNSKEHHMIGGNSSRLNANNIKKPESVDQYFSPEEIGKIKGMTKKLYSKIITIANFK